MPFSSGWGNWMMGSDANALALYDFESTANAGTADLFHSIGTEALGTLAAWTQGAALTMPTILNNSVSFPTASNSGMTAGHSDWTDITGWVRFFSGTGATLYIYIRAVNNLGAPFTYLRVPIISGTAIQIRKQINSGGDFAVSPPSVATVLANTWYWLQYSAVGTTYTATLYNDNAGVLGTAVAGGSVSGIASDPQLSNALIGLQGQGGTTACQVGGAFANVFYITGPVPQGWSTFANWNTQKEPAFAWSNLVSKNGSRSLSVLCQVPGASGVWIGPAPFALKSRRYTTQAWVYQTGSPGANYQSNSDTTKWSGNSTQITGRWVASTATFLANSSWGNQQFALQCSNNGASANVYWDYVTLETTDWLQAWSETPPQEAVIG